VHGFGFVVAVFARGQPSGATRRVDKSMYPLSLSTRSTITTSLRLTRMSLFTLRMRRRLSSDSKIMPSMLLYSSRVT